MSLARLMVMTPAAAHAAKVEAFDIAIELVLVDHHGGKGGRGVDDEDSNVLGFDAGVGEEVVKGAEHDLLDLFPGGWEEIAGKGRVVDELLEVDDEVIWGTAAREVEEVNGGGAGHGVEGGFVSSHVPRLIERGNAFIVERISTRFGKVDRGEVVSLRNPNKGIIKRLIGLEGDRLRHCSNADTNILVGDSFAQNNDEPETIVVPKGAVWVEGDNKNRSLDSRKYGPISYGLIRAGYSGGYYHINSLDLSGINDLEHSIQSWDPQSFAA
ncbi:hypothetical protein LR48_Vigan08g002100 [Vigna angularis]|uniref:Peptidase S26 domain-containing protein n=1 Tax=Phaseolus angularis TaxID=3914 RepID=A0A0L9V355_PHAAN|nr:hypothetical protein LR48_Vigan08g002100 [Vigna angularis]